MRVNRPCGTYWLDEVREQEPMEASKDWGGISYANEAKDYSVHDQPMNENTGQYHDEETEECLETADNGAPHWCMDHEDPAILAGCGGIARRVVLCHCAFRFSLNVLELQRTHQNAVGDGGQVPF